MLPLQVLVGQVEQIADRETRHRARSLLACYLGYGELLDENPAFAARARELQEALQKLGLSLFPAGTEAPPYGTSRRVSGGLARGAAPAHR